MRVLMLNYEYPPLGGGAGNATFYLLREFAKWENLTVDLITSTAKSRCEKEILAGNITIYKIPIRKKTIHYWTIWEIFVWSIAAFRVSHWLIRNHHYDACHCWFGWPSGLFGFWFRKKIPYLIALRGSDIPGYNIRLKFLDAVFFKYLSKITWKYAGVVTVLSEDSAKLAKKTLDRTFPVIHNGIDTRFFFPGEKLENGLKILSVGRLIPRKGIDNLIFAILDIRERYPQIPVHLTIVGSGILEKKLQLLSHQLNLGDTVSFTGAIDHEKLPAIYREHDLFVLPSLEEALGNVTQEAIASGLAILTTDTGAAELLDNNGFIIKKNDFKDISEKISIFIEDPNLLEKCKMRSILLAKTMSWNICAESYYRLYKDLAREP